MNGHNMIINRIWSLFYLALEGLKMSKTYWNTIIHKPTGKQYLYHYKLSWGVKYYSFDNEATWYTSRVAAFRHAQETNNLYHVDRDKRLAER